MIIADTLFYERLGFAAEQLAVASAQFGLCFSDLDAAMKTYNLGIATWIVLDGPGADLGYDKVDGVWRISVRQGEHVWLINNAPRALRLVAALAIPALIEALIESALLATHQIYERADALRIVLREVKPRL